LWYNLLLLSERESLEMLLSTTLIVLGNILLQATKLIENDNVY